MQKKILEILTSAEDYVSGQSISEQLGNRFRTRATNLYLRPNIWTNACLKISLSTIK